VSTHVVSHRWHRTVDRADSPRKPCSGGQRHICTRTGLTPATSAPGPGSLLPHLHWDWAPPGHASRVPSQSCRCGPTHYESVVAAMSLRAVRACVMRLRG
jgi:hypothetical protein